MFVGIIALAVRSTTRDRFADPRGAARLLILAAGSVLIFAGFINNKVPVYLPHLLIGFALAAGFTVSQAARLVRRPALVLLFVGVYGAVGVAYYEKWYASVGKSELVPYESTEATLLALVPPGPKYVFASPQFWPPFHAQPGTTFYSYAAAQPVFSPSVATLAGANDDRPIYLVVDEAQWLPELSAGVSAPTTAWQQGWIQFIERNCGLDSYALGTAHGTLALYHCALGYWPDTLWGRLIGGSTDYSIGDRVLAQTAADLARWTRYDDPRRTSSARPDVQLAAGGLRISGTGWPGIVKMLDVSPGQRYLVRVSTHNTHDGDLLYLGTWQQRQVRSLSGASSSGIPAPLIREAWFPGDRAFIATAPQVQVRIYSEAPATDFAITSLDVFRLTPRTDASRP
jgi:hypothetical protein